MATNELEPMRRRRLFGDLPSAVEDFFREALAPFESGRNSDVGLRIPAVDVREMDKQYLISIDMPGMNKEDIDIDISGNRLTISGERREERQGEEKGRRASFSEVRYGRFERSFTLPEDVDLTQVNAEYRSGVLEVAIPRAAAAKRSKIQIKDTQELAAKPGQEARAEATAQPAAKGTQSAKSDKSDTRNVTRPSAKEQQPAY